MGLLAFSPLGAAAGSVGISAAFAAVVAGGLVYALGGSAASPMGMPSSATALILAGLVMQLARDPALDLATPQGVAALAAVAGACVMLMGAVQIVMALLGFGRLARYVPQPVLAGFMNGVALMILVSQIPPLLGLPPLARLADAAFSQAQLLAPALGLAAMAAVWLLGWKFPRAPSALLAMLMGTAVYAAIAAAWPGASLGPTVGAIPQGVVLPEALLTLAGGDVRALLLRHASAVVQTAAVLAVIGSLESLLGALATDQIAQTRHDPRRELLALGAANIVSGACGGMALVLLRLGAISLIDAGAPGRAPVLASVATFALMYAVGGPLLALLPKAVLAGIMITVAVALIDRWTHQLLRQWRAGERSPEQAMSLAVVATVCAVTVTLGFVAGVAAGVVLSMLVFIRSMNRSLLRGRFSGEARPSQRIYGSKQEALLGPSRGQITLLELEGALFFGSAERLAEAAEALPSVCTCVILDFARVNTIDESGAMLLQQLSYRLARRGIAMLLAGVTPENVHGRRLRDFGTFRESPRDDWWPDADRAMEAAEQRLLSLAGTALPQATLALAETSLLHGLQAAQIERVNAVLLRHPLAAGDLLFRAGDAGDCVYVLTRGSISIVVDETAPSQRFVSCSPGAMFGEVAMLDGGCRSAAAVADTDAVVHSLHRGKFDELSAADPALGQHLLRNIALHLSARLRNATLARRTTPR